MYRLPEGWVNIQLLKANKYKVMGVSLRDLTRDELIAVAVEGLELKIKVREEITKVHKRVMERADEKNKS